MKQLALGQHLILDGYGCNLKRLIDQSFIWHFLDTCPLEIKMTKVSIPHVFEMRTKAEDAWGYSGFVLLAESHIFIHTFPDRGSLNLDIFSCKPFDKKKAIEYAVSLFSIKKKRVKQFDRGIEFPLEEANKITSTHREIYQLSQWTNESVGWSKLINQGY